MKRIPIDTKKDYLIIEKISGTTMLKGSRIYCGCCGKPVGLLKKDQTFPIDKPEFLENLGRRTVNATPEYWLNHISCGNDLFTLKVDWSFITRERFLELQKEVRLKKN